MDVPPSIVRSSAASGSTISPCAVSLPWASRIALGGTGGTSVGHNPQTGQHVIGPYRGGYLPYD